MPPNAITGGTGYDIKSKLAPKIEESFPDYSIYPECDHAIGYITRGCPNSCRWCIVPEKEGNITPYRSWRDLVRPDSKKLVLMDNNILASSYGISELASLVGSGYAIDLNQGMDARLITPEVADILSRLKWIKYIRFSCDRKQQIPAVENAVKLLAERGVKPWRVFIYLLVTRDVEDAAERVEALKAIGNMSIYAQAERNERLGIRPNAAQLEFSQRYIYGRSFCRETWEEYLKRHGLAYKEEADL